MEQTLLSVTMWVVIVVNWWWQSLIDGLDHVDWTTGLTFDLILGSVCNTLIIHIIELSTFLVSEASTVVTNYNNASTWSTAIVQTFKWLTQESHFHTRWLVSYLLINNSYCVVAISLQSIACFLASQSSTTATNMLLLYRHNYMEHSAIMQTCTVQL